MAWEYRNYTLIIFTWINLLLHNYKIQFHTGLLVWNKVFSIYYLWIQSIHNTDLISFWWVIIEVIVHTWLSSPLYWLATELGTLGGATSASGLLLSASGVGVCASASVVASFSWRSFWSFLGWMEPLNARVLHERTRLFAIHFFTWGREKVNLYYYEKTKNEN